MNTPTENKEALEPISQSLVVDSYIEHLFNNVKDPIKETAISNDLDIKEFKKALADASSPIRVELSKRITSILENTDIEKLKTFSELNQIGFSNISDYITLENGEVEFTDWSEISREKLSAIQEVRVTHSQYGPSIQLKMYSKLSALDTISKIVKLMEIQPTTHVTYNDNRLFSNIEEAKHYKPKEINAAI